MSKNISQAFQLNWTTSDLRTTPKEAGSDLLTLEAVKLTSNKEK